MARSKTFGVGATFLIAAMGMMVGALPVTATGVRPAAEPGAEAIAWLPSADAFGDGWTRLDPSAIELPADVFRENAIGVYLGPAGARVVVGVLLAVEGRAAVRRSWDEVTRIFDLYAWNLATDEAADDEFAGEPPLPSACVEGQRSAGIVKEFGNIVTGISGAAVLCAVDPDALILVAVSGEVLDAEGWRGADAVVEAVIAAGELAER